MNVNFITKTFKTNDKEIEVKIDLENSTVWLTQNSIAKILNVSRSWITRQLNKEVINSTINASVCSDLEHTGTDGKEYQVKHYSLEAILNIGYKIDVNQILKFKDWSENILKELKCESARSPLPIEVFEDGNFKLEVAISPKENTIWLTQEQIAKLFEVDRSNITKHINNILNEEELDKSNVQKMHIPFSDKMIYIYNLNMVISVGFRVNSKKATKFRICANKTLNNYLMKGYVIDENRATLYKENYIELNNVVLRLESKVDKHEERITTIENKIKTKEQTEKIFYQGEFYDSYSFLINLIKKANSNITLLDNYIDIKTLDILSNINKGVNIEIITQNNPLSRQTINRFNKQYNNLTIKINSTFHDRYVIIDNKELYLCGASIKDVRKKTFGIIKMSDESLNDLLIKI